MGFFLGGGNYSAGVELHGRSHMHNSPGSCPRLFQPLYLCQLRSAPVEQSGSFAFLKVTEAFRSEFISVNLSVTH